MAQLEHDGVVAFSMDVTDDASMVAGVDRVLAEQGRIDVLVNNAGYGSFGALEDVPLHEARHQFEVNVFGLARLVQLVLPTMREQGFDLVSYSWFGLSAPAKTPAPIVERIAREMQVVLKLPVVVKRWEEIGAESSTMTPAEYGAFVKAELEKWSPVVKASGARPE